MSLGVCMAIHSPVSMALWASASAPATTAVFPSFRLDSGDVVALRVALCSSQARVRLPRLWIALPWVSGFSDPIHSHHHSGLHTETFELVSESS